MKTPQLIDQTTPYSRLDIDDESLSHTHGLGLRSLPGASLKTAGQSSCVLSKAHAEYHHHETGPGSRGGVGGGDLEMEGIETHDIMDPEATMKRNERVDSTTTFHATSNIPYNGSNLEDQAATPPPPPSSPIANSPLSFSPISPTFPSNIRPGLASTAHSPILSRTHSKHSQPLAYETDHYHPDDEHPPNSRSSSPHPRDDDGKGRGDGEEDEGKQQGWLEILSLLYEMERLGPRETGLLRSNRRSGR
ncbi:hypothetical protein BJ875DRAFT_487605 [Amylocarpus encephaloides]|uniref:Uncharacterized protein n=1 Tax=Amylocarpus encephaloides TaxID=45428 RepID=A0A9P8C3A1_9HELO|nr:hypothetical protein BJ875DRAFT_487605 [Amylocarpus encephaloides]